MTGRTMISVEQFVANTPEVVAERIECTECVAEYIGDPDNKHVCPGCSQ